MARPSPAEIEDAVRRILLADLEVSPALLTASDAQTPLLGRGIGLDSIEAMGLALGLERRFDIQIPDGDLTVELFESIGALAAYVDGKVREREGQRAGA
jgi:acyl carrier protein